MNPIMKILLGGVATAALAGWLNYGPHQFGANCAAGTTSVAPPSDAPATVAAVADCQAKVNAAVAGKTINFTSGGANIAVDSQPLIDAIAADLKDCAGTSVEVQGHTDASGGDAANLRLSEARAASVVAALTAKGVTADKLSAKGFGETVPLDPANTPAAYAKNRRIEFKVAASSAAPAAAGQ